MKFVLLISAALAVACGEGPASISPGGISPPVHPVRFADVYTGVFRDHDAPVYCTGCHAFLGAELSESELYDQLVDIPADRAPCAGQVRVVPGDPDASLLLMKLVPGASGCGEGMPAGGGLFGLPLSAEQIELVRRWIGDDALR